MSVDVSFLTTTQNGSYDRLAVRQKKLLEKYGIKSEVIAQAQTARQKPKGERVVVYSTFNFIPILIKLYKLEPETTVFMSDSTLITIPFLRIRDVLKRGYRVYTVSLFDQSNFQALGINLELKKHFIPDPNPSGETLLPDKRDIDFLTVGINERDFDRKGHYWNWLTELWGFKSVRVCFNLCYGKSLSNVSDEQLFSLYKKTKWYLATSHAETPHLPLIESYAFGTPSVYLNGHEFARIGIGIPIKSSFVSVKGLKNFFFFEIDSIGFLESIGKATQISSEEYTKLSKQARETFEKEYKMENRIQEFKEMLNL